MQSANDWQYLPSRVPVELLYSLISELVRHHEEQLTGNELSLDWESPSKRTRIIKYGTSNSLFNILNQEPEAVAVEYQLSYLGSLVFSRLEYRWPHLHDRQRLHPQSEQCIDLPQACANELLQYHIKANTSWLNRYRNSLCRERTAQINEVCIMAERDRVRVV